MFVKGLEISAPNLLSFMYFASKGVVRLEHVPRLSCLWIGDGFYESFIFNPQLHSSYISQLTNLKLWIPNKFSMETTLFPLTFPTLVNLKELELSMGWHQQCLVGFTSLIKASPSLSHFAMKLVDFVDSKSKLGKHCYAPGEHRSKRWEEQRNATIHSHKCLNVVELSGFLGNVDGFDLALHLLDIAKNLKKMILNTRKQTFNRGISEESRRFRVTEEYASMLEMELPPGAELVLL